MELTSQDPSYTELIGSCPLGDIPKIIGKYFLLKEMRMGFTRAKLISLARGEHEGTFRGAVKRDIFNRWGDCRGFSEADMEITAVQLGVDKLIWPKNYEDMDWYLDEPGYERTT